MPYREAPGEVPCHQCERPSRQSCPCCSRTACERHLPAGARMCGKCDEAYYRYTHREDGTGVLKQTLVVAVGAAAPAIISTALLPITIAVIFLGFPGVLWWRKAGDRRRFLAMMKARGALPEPDATLPPDEEALQRYQAKLADRRADQFRASFDVSESNAKPDPAP